MVKPLSTEGFTEFDTDDDTWTVILHIFIFAIIVVLIITTSMRICQYKPEIKPRYVNLKYTKSS